MKKAKQEPTLVVCDPAIARQVGRNLERALGTRVRFTPISRGIVVEVTNGDDAREFTKLADEAISRARCRKCACYRGKPLRAATTQSFRLICG